MRIAALVVSFLVPCMCAAMSRATVTQYELQSTLGGASAAFDQPQTNLPLQINFSIDSTATAFNVGGTPSSGNASYAIPASSITILINGQPLSSFYDSTSTGGTITVATNTYLGFPTQIAIDFPIDFGTNDPDLPGKQPFQTVTFQDIFKSNPSLTSDSLAGLPLLTSSQFAGEGTPTLTVVPEPASIALLALGSLVLLRRRR